MCKVPPGLAPLICRPVDLETLETLVWRLTNRLSTGCDGIPLEFYRYGPVPGPVVLLELLRSAINAYTAGMTVIIMPPTVCVCMSGRVRYAA